MKTFAPALKLAKLIQTVSNGRQTPSEGSDLDVLSKAVIGLHDIQLTPYLCELEQTVSEQEKAINELTVAKALLGATVSNELRTLAALIDPRQKEAIQNYLSLVQDLKDQDEVIRHAQKTIYELIEEKEVLQKTVAYEREKRARLFNTDNVEALDEARSTIQAIETDAHSWTVAAQTVDCVHTYNSIRARCSQWLMKHGMK